MEPQDLLDLILAILVCLAMDESGEIEGTRVNRNAALVMRFGLLILGLLAALVSSAGADAPIAVPADETALIDKQNELQTSPVTWGQAFDKHAPLAFFSVGSLVVGGILVGIRSENASELSTQSRGPDRDLMMAVSLAGLGSLVSAGAFWYYSRHDMQAGQSDTEVTGSEFSLAPILQNGGGLAARLRISFSALGG